MSDEEWTLAEVAAYAARHGLHLKGEHAAAMMVRLHQLAMSGRAAAQALPRQANKENEPACSFRVPL